MVQPRRIRSGACLYRTMPTDGRAPSSPAAARLFYLVDPGADGEILPSLRCHFEPERRVAVLVERRRAASPPESRRHRRAPVAERDPARGLPAELRHAARDLRLVQPMAPLGRAHEDSDLDVLVARAVALDPGATSELWWRLAPRALARLAGSADGGAPPALLGWILDELPGYDAARGPLARWLDAAVDRFAAERRVA
jgi:hypothetical protein